MYSKGINHFIVLSLFLSILSGYRLFTGYWAIELVMLFWLVGAVLGFGLVYFDRLLAFLFYTDEKTAATVSLWLRTLKFKKILEAMNRSRTMEMKLPMRNMFFLVVYLALAFLAGFSSDNSFGRGLIWGMGLHLIFDYTWDVFVRKSVELWSWGGKLVIGISEAKIVSVGLVIIFGMLSFIL